MKRTMILLMVVLVFCPLPALYAQSGSGNGLFSFTLSGYTVQGQLVNAIIHRDNSVTLNMNVNDKLRTSVGSVPMTGNGDWYGRVNGTVLSGTIQHVAGRLNICVFIFFCGDADYVGQGAWNGNLSGQDATGTFQGTITFTSSPFSQIPVNQPIALSGVWSATFQQSQS